jgi:hypothetical protein
VFIMSAHYFALQQLLQLPFCSEIAVELFGAPEAELRSITAAPKAPARPIAAPACRIPPDPIDSLNPMALAFLTLGVGVAAIGVVVTFFVVLAWWFTGAGC